MIRQIKLENFQAHKETILNLHPGVNVIAGSSNSGKSSILRAINWMIYNRPSGDSFVSHWARDTKGVQKQDTVITLTTETHTLERRKSKITGNTYSIDGKVLEAVGLDVPEEVTKALNVNDVNTQKQHDAPFLLSESSGEVARFFNKIVHFDAIDRYMSSLESKKRKTKSEIEHNKANITRLEESLNKYKWLEDAEILIAKMEKIEHRLKHLQEITVLLKSSLETYRLARTDIETADAIVCVATKLVCKMEKIQSSITPITEKFQRMQNTISGYIVAHEEGAGIDTGYAEKLVRRVERTAHLVVDLDQQCSCLSESIDTYGIHNRTVTEASADVLDLENSLPKTCPLCGKELDDGVHSHG